MSQRTLQWFFRETPDSVSRAVLNHQQIRTVIERDLRLSALTLNCLFPKSGVLTDIWLNNEQRQSNHAVS